ncbi:MAG: hypothetical protein IJG13_09085 [Kiritimatiellae bacterium]|nr:hypothetical protein [Kiritimatiellia bacterium]
METLALSIAVAATAFFAAHAEADDAMSLRPRTVEFEGTFCQTGVVTIVCPNRNFALVAQNGQHHFLFVEDRFDICQGDVAVVNGEFAHHDNGTVFKVVRHVDKLSRVSLPEPAKVSISDLVHGDMLYQRITTEGTLVLVRRDEIDASVMQLLVKDGATIINASITDNATNTINGLSLLGARLRMTGVMMQPTGARQIISNYLSILPDGLQAIAPPPADIFDAPALNLDSPWTPDEIVRMDSRRFDGVVMATWDGDQMMLAGRGYHRVKATLARPDELPAVGEHVTVVGFPDTDLYGINLIYARCRPSQSPDGFAPRPQPIATTLRHLLTDERGRPRINGYSHGRLLRIRGTVLDVQPSLAIFSINDDGLTMPVDCSSSASVIPNIETNSKIEAVVLAVVETDRWRESMVLPQTRGLKLILRSPTDLKVLANPPWWTPARLTAAVVFLAMLIVLIVIANRVVNRMIMRRKVSERTRLAVELHDSLSQTLAGVACQIAAGHDAVDEDPKSAKELLSTAERMLESSRTELKNCLFDLRSDTVDDPDFERAVSKTLTGLKPEADISIRFHVARSLMTDTTAHAVLCVIRELVANAINHGAARHIWVAGAESAGVLMFSVRDDGCGFDPKRRPGPRDGHFGLAGIHERLAELGGNMDIESETGNGTKVTATIRLRRETLDA